MFLVVSLAAVCVLCVIHVIVGRLRLLDQRPDIWKPLASGIGIAYAFLVLLPKLAAAQPKLEKATDTGIYGFLEHHSYLVALLGLVLYYGLDRTVDTLMLIPYKRAGRHAVNTLIYMHASGFAGYYLLIGYLISKSRGSGGDTPGAAAYASLYLFAAAMVLHFLSIDHGLSRRFPGVYDRFVRWIFVTAMIAGWLLGTTSTVKDTSLALWNSLFAGALLYATMKEKVPSAHHGPIWPFLAGVTGYSLLLLIVELLGRLG